MMMGTLLEEAEDLTEDSVDEEDEEDDEHVEYDDEDVWIIGDVKSRSTWILAVPMRKRKNIIESRIRKGNNKINLLAIF